MRHTNQQPFPFDLGQAAQQKLPKASYVFDLRKDRLDDHFSFAEHLAACWASQFMPHPLLNSGVWWQGFCAADRLTLIWWYVQINFSYCLMGKRGFAVVAGIGRPAQAFVPDSFPARAAPESTGIRRRHA